MAITVHPARERDPSFGERLSAGVGRGLDLGSQMLQEHQEKQAIKKLMGDQGEDVANLPPELRKLYLDYSLQGKLKSGEMGEKLRSNQKIISDIEKQRGLEPGSLSAYVSDPKMAEQISRPTKEKVPTLTEKPVPADITRKIKKTLADNPKASADELRSLMDEAEIPPVYSNPYTENRRRTEEQVAKTSEERRRALRQETLPIRQELAKKSQAAEKGIQNKEQLLNLVENGDINDPTFATLAEALPLNLGKRLLSEDTVAYKAGLVEEFGDLRNIFQGQTRIKEIDLLENKIADLYLTKSQKQAVLKSRINALRADIIRAEAAAELEDRDDLGVLQFEREVERIAKPKLEALFNQILYEQKSILEGSEKRKSDLPLDPKDPDDLEILQQILKEARGDKQEARKIAQRKGYKF